MTFRAVPSHGVVTLEVKAPGARTVDVSGDFTAWNPVKLVPAAGGGEGGGVWRISLPMTRGTHQINIRVNGGRWIVPPGLTPMTDEFGGTVGLLVVE
jgi:1,4-alpha-glucan branching enzyme